MKNYSSKIAAAMICKSNIFALLFIFCCTAPAASSSYSAQVKAHNGKTLKLAPRIDIACRPALYFGGEVGSGNEINKGSRYVVAGSKIELTKADSFVQSGDKYAFNLQYFVFGLPEKEVLAIGDFTNRLRIRDEVINQHAVKFTSGDGGSGNMKSHVVRTQVYLPAGESTITLTLDDDKKINESNENNNFHSFTIVVKPS